MCITGGIACGKSLLATYLNELGVKTLDADDVAHELIPDPAERRRIAKEVFSDPAKRKALEAKMHPFIREKLLSFDGVGIIPLLFELHWEPEYDIICCIRSEKALQLKRMIDTRGYSREEAEARLAAQLPVDYKAAHSHYVIENNSTPEELKLEARKLVTWLKNSMCLQIP